MFKPELRIRVYLQGLAGADWPDYVLEAFGALEQAAPTTTTGKKAAAAPTRLRRAYPAPPSTFDAAPARGTSTRWVSANAVPR